jgi:type I restriction enzyme R subunit
MGRRGLKKVSNPNTFHFNEKYLSQIPALQVLINLGYQYLSPAQALEQRLGKTGNVLLESILREQLKKINRILYKGSEYLFSEENIQTAIIQLKNVKYDGLLRTNEAIYDLLTLGTSLSQPIEGDARSYNLQYIDWRHPERNVYHVSPEFGVERNRRLETARPDIVLFVNGIPLGVIECKSPNVEVEEAVSQSLRNQSDEYLPKLFTYSQLVMGLNKNKALYATTGTAKKFWSIWKELVLKEEAINKIINQPLAKEQKDALFSGDFALARKHFDELEKNPRLTTEQDWALCSLCRPERLMELAFKFTVFDNGEKKIARYQQYFVVKSTLNRVKQLDAEGCRKGGMIWHSQGSGKSLTMVMLARNLALDPEFDQPRIVLVTDRDDLDKQLKNTFAACGMSPERATSGRNLLDMVAENKSAIITTLVHKFDKALNARKFKDESKDIFMLVDESHRTQFGPLAARMREMFPRACYLGFTGTPLMKKEKNNFTKFGGLIEPNYPIHQAILDKAVVPLLYEGRHVEMEQNKKAIDLWFERHTEGLTSAQKADLKKKYARAEALNKAEQVVYMRAFDISEHYRSTWQGTGFKGQLVAPDKSTALRYKQFLDELGQVSSEVVISPPDMREGYEEANEEPTDEVVKFWKKMMDRFGREEEYTKQIINQFKNGDRPEILIVVSKLLTGFDAPRNIVLYLCRTLREHNLLQAIARVNRLYDDKEFGFIIDYANILGELDKALTMYKEFEEYDEADLVGTLDSVNEEISKLPQKHSDLWDLFKTLKNNRDEEAYERHLADEEKRHEFYQLLNEYGKTVGIAISTTKFIMETSEAKLRQYKDDLKRFEKLRSAVKLRYAEEIQYWQYDAKIKKLLDTHIRANEVVVLYKPMEVFNNQSFQEAMAGYGSNSEGAKADAIAHAMKKVIAERMEEDPAFYEKFSKLIQQVIDDFRAQRIADLEYLKKVTDIHDRVEAKKHDDMPEQLSGNEDAMAYYGVISPFLQNSGKTDDRVQSIVAEIALVLVDIFKRNQKVQFWEDEDAKKRVVNEIDDYLFDQVKPKFEITTEQMDGIIEKTMRVAHGRSAK